MRPARWQPVPQRRLRQRLQQVDGQHRNLRHVDEILEPALRVVGVGIEAEDDAGGDFQPVAVERPDGFHHRHGDVLILAHGLERVGLRRLDADEQADEGRLAHQRENLRSAWRC